MYTKYAFNVKMTCEGCSNAVNKVLGKLGDKVQNISISLEKQLVIVESTLSEMELLDALKKTGKEVCIAN